MASTPSASALNAVLRCRGSIWTRNPPSKRPAPSGYSLGLGAGAQRDSHTERTRSSQTSAREAFLHGDRVVVAFTSPRVDGRMLREGGFRDVGELVYSKVSQLPEHARRAAQSAVVRQLARRLTPKLPGAATGSKITRIIKCETRRDSCRFVQRTSGHPAGVLSVSIVSPVVLARAGHLLNALRSLSVTALASQLMWWRPRSSTAGAAQHLLCQEDDKHYANGHSSADLTSTKRDPSCGQTVTEDRPG